MFRFLHFALLLVLAVALLATAAISAEPKATKTLDNLQAAYNGESNAHARYTAFAEKADKDGYQGAASLFRAAAQAEDVHAARFAQVIEALGAKPEAELVEVKLGTTEENLAAALKGETKERDEIYVQGIKQAEADKDDQAREAFDDARRAEGEHAVLYEAASKDLLNWKEAREFYVCPKCGKTVADLSFKYCPVCATPASLFTMVK